MNKAEIPMYEEFQQDRGSGLVLVDAKPTGLGSRLGNQGTSPNLNRAKANRPTKNKWVSQKKKGVQGHSRSFPKGKEENKVSAHKKDWAQEDSVGENKRNDRLGQGSSFKGLNGKGIKVEGIGHLSQP